MMKNNVLWMFLIVLTVACQQTESVKTVKINPSKVWVDSVYKTMSLKEKVGQLFMVAAYSNRDVKHLKDLKVLIKEHAIGGLCFFQGGPVRQANMTNNLQAASKVPMLIGIDAEWGLKMRLDSTPRFPYNMTLGAISDNKLIQKLGKQQGDNCKRMGIHINFAPVVDINTNPKNPIIGVRSYGEEKQLVTDKALGFVKGLESTGVLACVKHFPGHGDTHSDSHKTLPTIGFSAKRIDSVELYPFKKLFNYGVGSVMVAHLNVPSLEKQEGLPSSLSYAIVTELLQEKLNYKGLVITDALNMKGAANFKQPGHIDLAAFQAGNDILLFSENPAKGAQLIISAYEKGEISEKRLAHSVKKILKSKFKVGLGDYSPIVMDKLVANLNAESNSKILKEISAKAITLLKNTNNNIPFELKEKEKVGYIKLGDGSNAAFIKELKEKSSVTIFEQANLNVLLNKISNYNKVVISYHRKNYRLTKNMSTTEADWIRKIAKEHSVTFVSFASLYAVSKLGFNNVETVIIGYENSSVFQRASIDIIFGLEKAKGKLPASLNTGFLQGEGIIQ